MNLYFKVSKKTFTNNLTKQNQSSWENEEVPGLMLRKGKRTVNKLFEHYFWQERLKFYDKMDLSIRRESQYVPYNRRKSAFIFRKFSAFVVVVII